MDRKIGILTLRELIGLSLLVTMLLGGLLLGWYLGQQQWELSRQLEDCAWLALSGQWENARTLAGEAREGWERKWKLRAAFGDHTPMEEIDDLFAELTVYGAAGDRTEFASTCSALASRMEAVGNAHRLSWWNIL